MKDVLSNLLQNLPKILEVLPLVIKWVPIILLLIGLGFVAYKFYTDAPPIYICYNNQMYELKWLSKVYVFKGDTCVQM